MNRIALSIVLTASTCAVFAQSSPFTLFAAETNPGILGGNTSLYGGVQQYEFATTGSSATMGAGVLSSQVHDPAGLSSNNGKLYVGNRHGSNLGQGSVQEFLFDGTAPSGGTTIATASSGAFQGFIGFDFAPNSDLFVTTSNGGTRRYRDSGSGYASIGGVSSGSVRDVMISPDGSKMIETTTDNRLLITEVLANSFGSTTTFVVNGASSMHQMAMRGDVLYVTSFNNGNVYKVNLDANFNPISSTAVATTPGALGIAFSPDGMEMFVSSHTGSRIARFLNSGSNWNQSGELLTGHNMGYLATVPEPASLSVLGLGVLAVLRRRRKG